MEFSEVFASELALRAFALGTGYALVIWSFAILAPLFVADFGKMLRRIFDLIRSWRK